MNVQIPIVGQAYQLTDKDLSAQSLKNWYPQINQDTNKIISLQPWPGLTLFSDETGNDGGMHFFQDSLYKVTDQNLYSVDSLGAQSLVGEILGSSKCSIVSNAFEMIIVRDSYVYRYDGTDLTLINDTDIESPEYVTIINNQAVYSGIEGRFGVSDAGDLASVNGLNYATAESNPDALVAPFAHNQLLYLFGTETIETWYNTGTGSPPFDRVQGGIINKGTLSGSSISNNSRYIYFLGNDNIVYRLSGGNIETISTPAIAQSFNGEIKNAIGVCLNYDGYEFYYLTIPQEKTWCYCESSNSWFELTTGDLEKNYKATDFIYCYGKSLLSIGGQIFELDKNSYTNGGERIIRERVSLPISAYTLNPAYLGKRVTMNSLEVRVITGGDSAKVMISFSDSGGRSWSPDRYITGSKLGEYNRRIKTYQLGQFYDRLIRVRVSDPVFCAIHSASAELEVNDA